MHDLEYRILKRNANIAIDAKKWGHKGLEFAPR